MLRTALLTLVLALGGAVQGPGSFANLLSSLWTAAVAPASGGAATDEGGHWDPFGSNVEGDAGGHWDPFG